MPNTREKLIELLQHDNCPLFMVFGGEVDVLADYLIANGVTVQDNTEIIDEFLQQLKNAPITTLHEEPTIEVVQEWISVKDRLPEGECLAVSMQKGHSYKEMLVGYVYADAYSDTLYAAESDGEVLRNVTHWMPLPEPPKGE